MTKKEQRFYNIFLATTRSMENRPFKIRKNFDDFETHPAYTYVLKITSFFDRYSHIDPVLFFKAPYIIYQNDENIHFDISFYTTQKAVKAYSLYMKQLQEEHPDAYQQLLFIKDSLKFIQDFCIKNNISLDEYLTFSLKGHIPTWLKHVKERRVSIYAMFGFKETVYFISRLQCDEKEIFLGNIGEYISQYKIKFTNSQKAKKLVTQGLKIIKKYIENSQKDINI